MRFAAVCLLIVAFVSVALCSAPLLPIQVVSDVTLLSLSLFLCVNLLTFCLTFI